MPPFPTPCKGKSKSQPFAHTFALTGRRRLCTDTQGVALGSELTALSGRPRRRFELIEFLQRGCGLRRSSLDGLRRRNNELNELTNCRAARVRGIAPEGGSYSRIGACPYLPPVLIDSRCCPCKGRISLAGLAPQQDSRYEPLTGARFINWPQKVGASPYPKYEPLTGAMLSPQPSSPSLCKQSELQCYRPKARYNAGAPKRQPPHLPHIFPHLL